LNDRVVVVVTVAAAFVATSGCRFCLIQVLPHVRAMAHS
jgi:hypothetical protein